MEIPIHMPNNRRHAASGLDVNKELGGSNILQACMVTKVRDRKSNIMLLICCTQNN